MAKRKNKGLGIGALLNSIDTDIDVNKKELVGNLSNSVAKIDLDTIEVNPFQPRVDFEPEALQELSDSISVHGLIQPITVRHLGNGKYQLISGERRLRASKMAQLKEVPAYVRVANDQEMLEMALIENIQRQELNPIEIAITYGRLMRECDLTHKQLAERMGKGRATVSNFIRLLNLPEVIQKSLKLGDISMGHAKVLLGLDDIALQLAVYNDILIKKLSVRQAEALVLAHKGKKSSNKSSQRLPVAHQKVQDDLTNYFNTKVSLSASQNGKGKIVINFNNNEDLNRILDILDK